MCRVNPITLIRFGILNVERGQSNETNVNTRKGERKREREKRSNLKILLARVHHP